MTRTDGSAQGAPRPGAPRPTDAGRELGRRHGRVLHRRGRRPRRGRDGSGVAGWAVTALVVALAAGCSTTTPTTPSPVPSAPTASGAPSAPRTTTAPVPELAALEERYGARLGVWALDTGTGQVVEHRADERFAHASTVKLLLVGVLLQRLEDAELDEAVPVEADDVLEHAPVTAPRAGGTMSVRELMEAALVVSDNTAANLLLEEAGGPEGLQRSLRQLGDATTTTSRAEPDLNEAAPGDARDTSSPRALGRDLEALALGDALPPDRRRLLQEWLVASTTGGPYVRAGAPDGWRVGDKTGAGGYGTRNDVAVAWPPDGGAPVVLSLLSDRGTADAASDDALLADATRVVVAELGR